MSAEGTSEKPAPIDGARLHHLAHRKINELQSIQCAVTTNMRAHWMERHEASVRLLALGSAMQALDAAWLELEASS
jgi:hypothetical protein